MTSSTLIYNMSWALRREQQWVLGLLAYSRPHWSGWLVYIFENREVNYSIDIVRFLRIYYTCLDGYSDQYFAKYETVLDLTFWM